MNSVSLYANSINECMKGAQFRYFKALLFCSYNEINVAINKFVKSGNINVKSKMAAWIINPGDVFLFQGSIGLYEVVTLF